MQHIFDAFRAVPLMCLNIMGVNNIIIGQMCKYLMGQKSLQSLDVRKVSMFTVLLWTTFAFPQRCFSYLSHFSGCFQSYSLFIAV